MGYNAPILCGLFMRLPYEKRLHNPNSHVLYPRDFIPLWNKNETYHL
jgi:hypothetical protein